MRAHVVCNYGERDTYRPCVGDGEQCAHVVLENDAVETHIRSNARSLFYQHGIQPSELCIDFMSLATTVFTADTRISRSYADDGWGRTFELHIPVADPRLWETAVERISTMLAFLTGDSWTINFRPRSVQSCISSLLDPSVDAVSLFSGGLDSFIGAVEQISQVNSLALVGHYSDGSVSRPQAEVFSSLIPSASETGTELRPYRFYVAPPNAITAEVEHTMRGRSFLFLALGIAVANSYGDKVPLLVPENGFISLNVPLTKSRQGSLSTRTTHPHFIELFRGCIAALGMNNPIKLEYRFMTKGQMVQRVCDDSGFVAGWEKTMSCAHPAANRWSGGSSSDHCGYCFPCLIRRASLFSAGLDDASQYAHDVITAPPSNGCKKAEDLYALRIGVARFAGLSEARSVFEVLKSGPIPQDVTTYMQVFKRGIDELKAFLNQ